MLPAQHGVRRAGGLGFGHPDHPERVHRPEEPRDQGHEQRDLERERTRLGVDADDLVAVILAWGCVNPPGPCPADADGSGVVDADDLVMVILAWGPCP